MAESRDLDGGVRGHSPLWEDIGYKAGLKSFGSVLIRNDLKMIWGIYFILVDFEVELAGPRERDHLPPPRWLGVYDEALKAGLRFFLHPFVVELMEAFLLSPSQIVPNSWRFVIGFLCLCLL